MKLNLAKFAMIGACALSVALLSEKANAQAMTFEPGAPRVIAVTAAVSNTINATVTAPTFGNLGVIRSSSTGENATVVMTPAGTITATPDGSARIVTGGGHAAGIVAITGGFANTPVHVTYSAPVNLTCTACPPGTPELELIRVTDDLTTPTVLDVLIPANTVSGTGTILPDNSLTFHIGATLQTSVGASSYATGAYAGSFSATIQY